MNSKSSKFSPEVRKRTVQMVLDHKGEYPSLWAIVQPLFYNLPILVLLRICRNGLGVNFIPLKIQEEALKHSCYF